MLRRDDAPAVAELLEQRIPRGTGGAVQKHNDRARASVRIPQLRARDFDDRILHRPPRAARGRAA